jgi:hypothetical protein
MAKVTIGGKEYEGSLRTFAKLEAAWPYVIQAQEEAKAEGDPANYLAKMTPMMAVAAVAVGMRNPDGTPDTQALKELLEIDEMGGLTAFFSELLSDARVTKKPGELPAVAGTAETPSTATLIP